MSEIHRRQVGLTALPEPLPLDRARMRRIRTAPNGVTDRGQGEALVVLPRGELEEVIATAVAARTADRRSGETTVLTRKEIADFLKISTKTVALRVKREGMPCKRFGKEYRFIKADVLDWMRSSESGMTNEEAD